MTLIRESISGMDAASVCEACAGETARLVLEDFPEANEHISLCEKCAADALSEHPKLLASAVVTLILMGQKSIKL